MDKLVDFLLLLISNTLISVNFNNGIVTSPDFAVLLFLPITLKCL